MAKICIICNEDCSNEPRFKNEDGHYVCARCHAIQQDNDQQQVDETEAPTPKWAVFCRYCGVAIFVFGLVSVTTAYIYAYWTMGPNNPWFPGEVTSLPLLVLAVLVTTSLLFLCARELRFLSHLVKFILVVPALILAAITGSEMAAALSILGVLIMTGYTLNNFPDLDDDDNG